MAVVSGLGDYNGSLTIKFTINKVAVASATIEGTYTYDGSEQAPAVKVMGADGKTLVRDVDYTLVSTSATAAGSYENAVKVAGKGGYTGTKELTFTIAAADIDGVNFRRTV